MIFLKNCPGGFFKNNDFLKNHRNFEVFEILKIQNFGKSSEMGEKIMRATIKMILTQSSTVLLQDPGEFPGAAQPPPTRKARYFE